MALPLLTRAKEEGVTFVHVSPSARSTTAPPDTRDAKPGAFAARMPDRRPGRGEQYRFHFDMSKCIGCKCCVVACNEQNGNPAPINWRRVGEIEGGWYPNATRSYLSMGCNHCLEPTCLQGCPVDAYSKDSATGIVRHSADTCIGCQYCTWNCSYGVPQYNPDRGVVGKCDMCYGRLEQGQAPACVSACPEGAIAIEIVKIDDWREACETETRDAGVPGFDGSLSTTRLTLPDDLPPQARPRDLTHVAPEHPHWSLITMTVLTQLSVGAFVTLWLLQGLGAEMRFDVAAIASLLIAGLALSAATLHLGRPIHAYRALKMWRRSWLSREVLLFGAFSKVAGMYAASLFFSLPFTVATGAVTALLGVAGVYASACIYRVPARPAWNSSLTVAQFIVTGALLGTLFAATLGAGAIAAVRFAVVAIAAAEIVLIGVRFLRLIASDVIELRGTARLLSTVLAPWFVLRGALLLAGGVALPLVADGYLSWGIALLLAFGAEIVGRYLFFVSVVPRHMTSPYLALESEAA